MERCRDGGKRRNRKPPVFGQALAPGGGRGKEEPGQRAAEARGRGMRGRPERRDVVEPCLQATTHTRAVALCVTRSQFVTHCLCKPIIKRYLHQCRQLVHFSGNTALSMCLQLRRQLPRQRLSPRPSSEGDINTQAH